MFCPRMHGLVREAGSVDIDLAGISGHESDHHVEAGGLAGPVGPEQANDFAGADAEGDVLDHSTRFVAFFQVVGGERCRRLRHASSP